MPWTSQTVEEFIAARGLRIRVLRLHASTHTVEDAARELGTDVRRIAKTLLAHLADGRFVVAILRGDTRLDRRKLCRAAQAKAMTLAKADEVLEVTGYPVGGVPPFPLKTDIAVFIDRRVMEVDTVFGGGGEVDALVEAPTEELLAVTRGTVADLAIEERQADPI
jgi:Cys-tRNA(Pro) deacylase